MDLKYESYTDYLRTLKDERWLLAQCASPEFYTNLRTWLSRSFLFLKKNWSEFF